jgi:hypothetical protein
MKSFSAQVDRIIVNTDKRMNLVMKQSLQNTINEMQTPTSKGGKMRMDTGFLRASGQSSLNGMPTGPSRKPAEGQFDWTASDTTATIGKMKFGSTFFWGWTANYARVREAYDGFRDSALQNWQQTVDKVVADAKRRFS